MTDTDLERRLRRALAARARAVTAQDLRPVAAEHREARVRWWLPFSAGLAAAAVLTLIFVVFHRPAPEEHPIAPAGSIPVSGPARPSSASATPSTLPTGSVVPGGSVGPATAGAGR
jgi:hypothetical protein